MTLAPVALAPALAGRRPPSADAAALRAVAARLDTAAQGLESAAEQLSRDTAELRVHWRGAAATAGLAELAELQQRARNAATVHDEAASVLLACAHRLDEAQATWQRAKALERRDRAERAGRAAAGARGEIVFPYDLDGSGLRQAARSLADHAHEEAEAATARAAAQLHDLADRAPRPGDVERRRLTAYAQVAGVGRGAVEAVWGSITFLAGLSTPRFLVDRDGWFAQVRDLHDGATYAAAHPREAARAAAGWDLLEEGRYGEWAGGLLPDLVGGVLTGGALPAGRRAAEVGDELAELARDVDDLQRVHERKVPGASPDAGGPVVAGTGVELPPLYPRAIRDLQPHRRVHILDGDPPEINGGKGGGHRAGTGRGKSEFPAEWTDDDIIRRVMDTAMHPQRTEEQLRRKDTKLIAYAEHDGVLIKVVLDPDGYVVTGYPIGRTSRRVP